MPDQVILTMAVKSPDADVRFTYLREHPLTAGLHAQTPIMHEQHEVGAFAIATLPKLQLGLVWWRWRNIPVKAQFNGHTTSLHIQVIAVCDFNIAGNPLTKPMYIHVRCGK
jgi:hypothetical protein